PPLLHLAIPPCGTDGPSPIKRRVWANAKCRTSVGRTAKHIPIADIRSCDENCCTPAPCAHIEASSPRNALPTLGRRTLSQPSRPGGDRVYSRGEGDSSAYPRPLLRGVCTGPSQRKNKAAAEGIFWTTVGGGSHSRKASFYGRMLGQ